MSAKEDIVQRLRDATAVYMSEDAYVELFAAAADEIERLRRELISEQRLNAALAKSAKEIEECL